VRRSAAVFIVSVVLGLASAATAGAGQSQAGCQAYGGFVSAAVQANIPGGQVVSGIATSATGAVAGFVASAKDATCQ
jgi:hypothetical protein